MVVTMLVYPTYEPQKGTVLASASRRHMIDSACLGFETNVLALLLLGLLHRLLLGPYPAAGWFGFLCLRAQFKGVQRC